MRRTKSLLAQFLLVTLLMHQTFIAFSQGDSTKMLSANAYIEIVKKFHPLAKQASLIPEIAQAELLSAKGGWDPKINSDYYSKTYNGINYYSYFETKVSIPTWYGIEVKTGYDFAYGSKLNSETKLPSNGLGYVGISVPLVKNLMLDKQRAALQQAKLFKEASEQQRLVLLNELLLNALTTYYEWSYAYNEYDIYKEAVRIAQVRFEATKKLATLGDRSAIDTTEALTQLQSRQFQLNDAKLNYLNAGLELSNFLWIENDQPYQLDASIIPADLYADFTNADIQLSKLDELINIQCQTHPALLNYNYKLKQLEVERKLKIENLKPSLNVNYNLLSEQFSFKSTAGLIFNNNFKFGLNFSMPLTFMQGRGELKITKLKIQETSLAIDYKRQELVNKLKSYFNDLLILRDQIQLYEQTLNGYKQLLDGENVRLYNGESSLFLVNARENKYLESQLKLRELQAKYYKTEASIKWAVGNISQ
jgi:outer membrane protein TolC